MRLLVKRLFVLRVGLWLLLAACQSSHIARFTNPLLPRGADPWSIYNNGFYFYTHTLGDRIEIWKTKSIADLATAPHKTVFKPPPGLPYAQDLWAPEIHLINHKWYVYFAADSGNNASHRIWVLENGTEDPLEGDWILKGKVTDSTDKWAIDASVFSHRDTMYMIWSGWEGDTNGRQNIYISRMNNPWTLSGNRVQISTPIFDWESFGDLHDANNPAHVYVNEGPQFLARNKKVFIVYSASGCWTDYYALGMLSADTNSNLLDAANWRKSPQPVFKQSIKNKVYAPGHNSFFASPDGKEDWILYHANDSAGQGCGGKRTPRAQPFGWNTDDTPNFGEPVSTEKKLRIPSETKRRKNNRKI